MSKKFQEFTAKMVAISQINTVIKEKKVEIEYLKNKVKKIEEEIKHLFPLPH